MVGDPVLLVARDGAAVIDANLAGLSLGQGDPEEKQEKRKYLFLTQTLFIIFSSAVEKKTRRVTF